MIFLLSFCEKEPSLLYWLYTKNYANISGFFESNIVKISDENLQALKKVDPKYFPADIVSSFPNLNVDFELNVNAGINNTEKFVFRENLSYGQKAVGMLLLVMYGITQLGETSPLIFDQPEDDLDNSYIYNVLVKEFEKIKGKRQLIIASHNANIPIAGYAENIIILESDGSNGFIKQYGTIENNSIKENVLKILEGDYDGFLRRAEIYGFSKNDFDY